MTVEELIALLEDCDPEAEVRRSCPGLRRTASRSADQDRSQTTWRPAFCAGLLGVDCHRVHLPAESRWGRLACRSVPACGASYVYGHDRSVNGYWGAPCSRSARISPDKRAARAELVPLVLVVVVRVPNMQVAHQ